MPACCCPHAVSTGRFFSRFARLYRRRFEKHGFELSQQQLLAGLEQAGFGQARLLEIGSGVGHLHQTLLERGADAAIGVELAPEMIEQARQWAERRGLAGRVSYHEGDFMLLAGDLPMADVTVLDKVVCCYPDAEGLVKASLAKTRRVYALTYPRKRWFVRAGVALLALGLRLLRSDFRPYVHEPAAIRQWIRAAGFMPVYQGWTAVWHTQVYVRRGHADGGVLRASSETGFGGQAY